MNDTVSNTTIVVRGGRTAIACTFALFIYAFACGDIKENVSSSLLNISIKHEWPIWISFTFLYAWSIYQYWQTAVRNYGVEFNANYSNANRDGRPEVNIESNYVKELVKSKLEELLSDYKERQEDIVNKLPSPGHRDFLQAEGELELISKTEKEIEKLNSKEIVVKKITFKQPGNSVHVATLPVFDKFEKENVCNMGSNSFVIDNNWRIVLSLAMLSIYENDFDRVRFIVTTGLVFFIGSVSLIYMFTSRVFNFCPCTF